MRKRHAEISVQVKTMLRRMQSASFDMLMQDVLTKASTLSLQQQSIALCPDDPLLFQPSPHAMGETDVRKAAS